MLCTLAYCALQSLFISSLLVATRYPLSSLVARCLLAAFLETATKKAPERRVDFDTARRALFWSRGAHHHPHLASHLFPWPIATRRDCSFLYLRLYLAHTATLKEFPGTRRQLISASSVHLRFRDCNCESEMTRRPVVPCAMVVFVSFCHSFAFISQDDTVVTRMRQTHFHSRFHE